MNKLFIFSLNNKLFDKNSYSNIQQLFRLKKVNKFTVRFKDGDLEIDKV